MIYSIIKMYFADLVCSLYKFAYNKRDILQKKETDALKFGASKT